MSTDPKNSKSKPKSKSKHKQKDCENIHFIQNVHHFLHFLTTQTGKKKVDLLTRRTQKSKERHG